MKKKLQIEYIPIEKVVIAEGWNPRWTFDDKIEEELKQSILENGMRYPISVYKEKESYIVIDGERRVRAFRKIYPLLSKDKSFKAEVPAYVEEKPEGVHGLYISLVANDGLPLLPIEEAHAFERLRQKGERVEDIARKLGKTTAFVSSRLSLFKSSPAVQEAVKNGKIGVTLASKLAKKPKEEQKKLIKEPAEKIKKELGIKPRTTKVQAKIPRKELADTIDAWLEENFYSYDVVTDTVTDAIELLIISIEKLLKKHNS